MDPNNTNSQQNKTQDTNTGANPVMPPNNTDNQTNSQTPSVQGVNDTGMQGMAGPTDEAKINEVKNTKNFDKKMLSGKGLTGPEPVIQKGQAEQDLGGGVIMRRGPSIGGDNPSGASTTQAAKPTTEQANQTSVNTNTQEPAEGTIPMPKTVNTTPIAKQPEVAPQSQPEPVNTAQNVSTPQVEESVKQAPAPSVQNISTNNSINNKNEEQMPAEEQQAKPKSEEVNDGGPTINLPTTVESAGPPPPKVHEPKPMQDNGLPPLKKDSGKDKQKKKGGGFSLMKTIRRLGCLILLLIVLAVVTLAVTLIFRPPVTWNPVKDFLNAGFSPETIEDYTAEQTVDIINSSVSGSGETTLTLNESQVTALIRSVTGSGSVVEFEQNTLRIVSDIDSETEKPLWLIIEFRSQTEQEFGISKIGFSRLDLPNSINNIVNSFVLNLVNLSQGDISGDQTPESLISAIIASSTEKEIEILDVKFKKDEIEIRYGVK